MEAVVLASAASRKAHALARSLAGAGYRVVGCFHRPHPMMFSRYISRRCRVADPRKDPKAFALGVAKVSRDCGAELVIPVDFVDVVALSRHRDLIERYARLAAPDYEDVVAASSKDRLPELLGRLGVKLPESRVVEPGRIEALRELEPPIVIKGLSDASSPEYAATVEEAAEIVRRRGRSLAQEYIAGAGHGYFVVAARGEPLLEFAHRRLVEQDPAGGASMAARAWLDPRIIRIGRRVVRGLRWTGMLMVELRKEAETGEYFVIELNPKFWGSLELAVEAGADFPRILAAYFLRGAAEAREEARRLRMRLDARYVWTLDGARYLNVDPRTWMRLAGLSLAHPLGAELPGELIRDPAKIAAQAAYASAWILSRRRAQSIELRRCIERAHARLSWFLDEVGKARRLHLTLDLDGTLVALPVDWRRVRRELAEAGLSRPYEGVLEALVRLMRRDPEGFARASRIIERHELEAAKRVRPDPRLARLLGLLRSCGASLILVTRQSAKAASAALGRLGVERVFDRIITREQHVRRLDQLRLAAPGDGRPWAHIGDTLTDVVAAMRAGAFPILVAADRHRALQAVRLGVPAGGIHEVLRVLAMALRRRAD